MSPIARTLLCSAAVLVMAGAAIGPVAAAPDIQLPPETAKLRPSTLPGFAIAMQKCGICHSADYVAYQPPRMTLTQWNAEVSKMRVTYGAPINDSDVHLVGIYLAATYGDASSVAPADLALKAAVASSVEAPMLDAQALLNKNACLGCHALSQKLVGPAYHDVAAKYRADPDALSKVAASIRQGGVGRWGTIPMPAFNTLSESELKTLATFVLAQ